MIKRIVLNPTNGRCELEPTSPFKLYLVGTENSLLKNGNGVGETAWVDSNSDGLADYWNRTGTDATCTIINATDGFPGYAQKFVCAGTAIAYYIYVLSTWFSITNGATYNYSFKYKSNIGLSIGNPSTVFASFSASPSSVTSVSGSFTASYSDYLFFMMTGIASIGNWAIIDEVNLTIP